MESWRISIDGESVAPPLVKNNIIVVATIDGKLRGYSVHDGVERWMLEQKMPALTLRGSSIPVIVGTTVVAGFDNGRLVAAELSDGAVEWESMLSQPTGRSDLERLADVDGAIAAVGQDVYAAAAANLFAPLAVWMCRQGEKWIRLWELGFGARHDHLLPVRCEAAPVAFTSNLQRYAVVVKVVVTRSEIR